MSEKDLQKEPHNINPHSWWYEENYGVTIVVEPVTTTRQIKIPWRSIRAALKRKDKP